MTIYLLRVSSVCTNVQSCFDCSRLDRLEHSTESWVFTLSDSDSLINKTWGHRAQVRPAECHSRNTLNASALRATAVQETTHHRTTLTRRFCPRTLGRIHSEPSSQGFKAVCWGKLVSRCKLLVLLCCACSSTDVLQSLSLARAPLKSMPTT